MALGDKLVNLDDLKVVGDAVGGLKSAIDAISTGNDNTVVLQITEDSENVLHLGKSYNDLKAMADSGKNIVAIWNSAEDYYSWYPLTRLIYSDMFIPPYNCIFGFSFDVDCLSFGSSTATDEFIMQMN